MWLHRWLGHLTGREGGSRNPVKDVTVGFGPDRPRMNVYCKEAPGLVIFTDPAVENEGGLNSLPEKNFRLALAVGERAGAIR